MMRWLFRRFDFLVGAVDHVVGDGDRKATDDGRVDDDVEVDLSAVPGGEGRGEPVVLGLAELVCGADLRKEAAAPRGDQVGEPLERALERRRTGACGLANDRDGGRLGLAVEGVGQWRTAYQLAEAGTQVTRPVIIHERLSAQDATIELPRAATA